MTAKRPGAKSNNGKSVSYLVVYRLEGGTSKLVEIFIDVLIWAIAGHKCAVDDAIGIGKVGQCAVILSLFEIVEQP